MRDLLKLMIVGLPLLVGACGLPPAIVAFSYAVDGFSYASSGKGMSDHVLSAAIDQDCAMFRAIQGKEICHDNPPLDGDVVIASAAEMPEEAEDGLAQSLGIDTGAMRGPLAAMADPDPATLINPKDSVIQLDSSRGHPSTARLVDFPAASEVYALVQDNGALEIFVYRASDAGSGDRLSHIATYENYSENPTALEGVMLGGAFHAIGDLIV